MIDLLTKVLNMRWDFFLILILASQVIFHFILTVLWITFTLQ